MAEGVTLSSAAALEMLPAFAAAWNTQMARIGSCIARCSPVGS